MLRRRLTCTRAQGNGSKNGSRRINVLNTLRPIVPGYNIFFAFKTQVRVIEPNPNWSAVGLWLQKRLATEARDYSSGGPQPQTGAQPRVDSSPTSKFSI